MTLSLAFLSPVLAEAAMEGRLPRGFSARRLTDLPMLWSEQWGVLGLREPIQAQPEPSWLSTSGKPFLRDRLGEREASAQVFSISRSAKRNFVG